MSQKYNSETGLAIINGFICLVLLSIMSKVDLVSCSGLDCLILPPKFVLEIESIS